MKSSLYVTALIALAVVCPLVATATPLADEQVLVFDCGPVDSAIHAGSRRLSSQTTYTSNRGFGWVGESPQAFSREKLARSRTPMTIDGVVGKTLRLRADVSPGQWYTTLWCETHESPGDWPMVTLQGVPQPLDWQKFRPPAEPSREYGRTYRVFHCVVDAESDGLVFTLTSQRTGTRLLGVTLIKKHSASAKGTRSAPVLQVDYRRPSDLTATLERLANRLRENPHDAHAAIWHQRLTLMDKAEKYFAMRGWEAAKQATGMSMFDRHHQAVMLLDGLLQSAPDEISSLVERARYLRGQLLFWLGKERRGADEQAAGHRDLEWLMERYPHDQLLAMYTGAKIDLPDACDRLQPTPGAPEWSQAQCEVLCRMRAVAHWWVRQQRETGEFGGKWGDDVELLRWWAPLCLAGDQEALAAWQRLADGVWHCDRVRDGYARRVSDVEHAAEYISDTAPLLAIYRDEPRYLDRLRPSATYFEKLWTGITPHGHRHFRSAWFSATEVETSPPKCRDVEYNTRAVQPMRYLARRDPSPKLVELLHEWSLAWVDAALRTDKGKPRGVIPASIRYSDEAINGEGSNWYQADMFWSYYEWQHHAGSLILDQLLYTYLLTGDEKLLQPMHLTLAIVDSANPNEVNHRRATLTEGSAPWAAAQLRKCRPFWHVVEQWRFLTGETRWDDLICRFGSPYGKYRVSGDDNFIVYGFEQLLDELRFNMPLKTSAAMYTDRVYVPGWESLKAALTGDGMYANSSPYHWVTWEQTDEQFTALVADTGRELMHIHLFSHAVHDQSIVMRVWQLPTGVYELKIADSNRVIHEPDVRIEQRGQRVSIELPARRLLRISFQQVVAAPTAQ